MKFTCQTENIMSDSANRDITCLTSHLCEKNEEKKRTKDRIIVTVVVTLVFLIVALTIVVRSGISQLNPP